MVLNLVQSLWARLEPIDRRFFDSIFFWIVKQIYKLVHQPILNGFLYTTVRSVFICPVVGFDNFVNVSHFECVYINKITNAHSSFELKILSGQNEKKITNENCALWVRFKFLLLVMSSHCYTSYSRHCCNDIVLIQSLLWVYPLCGMVFV